MVSAKARVKQSASCSDPFQRKLFFLYLLALLSVGLATSYMAWKHMKRSAQPASVS
jgi:hypothetical protein